MNVEGERPNLPLDIVPTDLVVSLDDIRRPLGVGNASIAHRSPPSAKMAFLSIHLLSLSRRSDIVRRTHNSLLAGLCSRGATTVCGSASRGWSALSSFFDGVATTIHARTKQPTRPRSLPEPR